MSLDMYNLIGPVFNTQPEGGVTLIQASSGGYYDQGEWVAPEPTTRTLDLINIQPANNKTMEFMAGLGGTQNPRDVRQVWVNDGTELFPADNGRESDFLEFTDGLGTHKWRVMASDNRPWHSYCKAIVERTRNA